MTKWDVFMLSVQGVTIATTAVNFWCFYKVPILKRSIKLLMESNNNLREAHDGLHRAAPAGHRRSDHAPPPAQRAPMRRGIGEPFVQGDKLPGDGPVKVRWLDDNRLALTVENDNKETSIIVSDYNASRIWAYLALMLGIKIPRNVEKKILL